MWGYNLRQLERFVNQKFLEKRLGQHIGGSNDLSSANVEKGREAITQISEMIVFDGAIVVFSTSLALLFILAASWEVFLMMLFAAAWWFFWLVFLNQKVLTKTIPIEKDFRRVNRRRVDVWDHIQRVVISTMETKEVVMQDQDLANVIKRDRTFWLWYIKIATIRTVLRYLLLWGAWVFGAWSVWNGHWEHGTLVAIFVYTRNFANNLWRIQSMERQLNMQLPRVLVLKKIFETPPSFVNAPDAFEIPSDIVPNIRFLNVSSSYSTKKGKGMQVIRDVNLDIPPGCKVGVIGQSGAGKTTLMRLLLRYFDPDSGAILVNGIPLTDITYHSWLNLIGYVPQRPEIFEGTIRDNLLCGVSDEVKETLTDEKLWAYMEEFRADFGDRLVDGLGTKVGRNGIELSGGEQQRLMVLAAVLRKAKIMVIDEATSSLDSSTEKDVQSAIARALGNDVSAFIIAHRLSTIRNTCDQFIVLRPLEDTLEGESQIEAQASSFEELYDISPTFRRLADDQGILVLREASNIVEFSA